jgi:hypothetical protein
VSQLYLVAAGEEITRRRARLPAGSVIEAWADLYAPGSFWLSGESKTLLDSVGEPVPVELGLPASSVAVYYGPRLRDLDSLPPEESLKARVLSAHGVAAAWVTLDRFGERVTYQPTSPRDPVFHLRRRGGGAGHVWRLFPSRGAAVTYMAEAYGEAEGMEWAEAVAVEDFDALLKRYGTR